MLCNDWKTVFKSELFSVRRSPLWMMSTADTQNWHTIAFSSPTLLQNPTRRVNKPDEAETHGTMAQSDKNTLCVCDTNWQSGKNIHSTTQLKKIQQVILDSGYYVYLIIFTSSLMLTWSGTRNLVLSKTGSCFSPLYLSMITCKENY